MKEGHAPRLLSQRPPPGPGLTVATTRPGEGAGRAGPPEQHLGLAPAGTKGSGGAGGRVRGGSRSRRPAANFPPPAPPEMTAFRKKGWAGVCVCVCSKKKNKIQTQLSNLRVQRRGFAPL